MLQLPKRGEGYKVRKCIRPNAKKGHTIVVSADYVQEELMLLAGTSRDETLFACYSGDEIKDVHSVTAAPFAGMSYEAFEEAKNEDKRLSDMRTNLGKATNFGSVYGIGHNKLSRKTLQPVQVAKDWLAGFDRTYPGIKEWKAKVIAGLREKGFTEDLYGCRRHIYNKCYSMNDSQRGAVDRQVISSQIQGLAASIAKKVMAKLFLEKVAETYDATFYGCVYDEFVFSLNHEVAIPFIHHLHRIMTEEVPGLGLPLRADISLGPSWGKQYECGRVVDEAAINEAIQKTLGNS
jgi:DNA polymerase-1